MNERVETGQAEGSLKAFRVYCNHSKKTNLKLLASSSYVFPLPPVKPVFMEFANNEIYRIQKQENAHLSSGSWPDDNFIFLVFPCYNKTTFLYSNLLAYVFLCFPFGRQFQTSKEIKQATGQYEVKETVLSLLEVVPEE